MDPDHYGQTGCIFGSKDVEEEAVFVCVLILLSVCLGLRIAKGVLRALGAVLASIDDGGTVERGWLWRLPAEVAGGRRGESNALPGVDVGGGVESTSVLGVAEIDGEVVGSLSVLALCEEIGERLRRDGGSSSHATKAEGECE